jgi:hypothetical protein
MGLVQRFELPLFEGKQVLFGRILDWMDRKVGRHRRGTFRSRTWGGAEQLKELRYGMALLPMPVVCQERPA